MKLFDFLRKPEKPSVGNCHFCFATLTEREEFELVYKAKDGQGSIKMCKDCADTIERIKLHDV